MSGSYSNFARFPSSDSYIFAWQSRGALDLTENAWMGDGYTECSPRWLNHNVAISIMANKTALMGEQATSVVGAAEGDLQVNWITYSTTEDHQNVHVEALNSNVSMVSWEVLTDFTCQAVPLGCSGTFAGTGFQFIDSTGTKVGQAVNETAVTVSGDFARVGSKLCWPFVDQTWDLSAPKDSGTLTTKMSFACAAEEGDSTVSSTTAAVAATSNTDVSSSVSTVVASTTLVTSSVSVVASDVPAISTSSIAVVAQQASVPASVSTSSTIDISEAANVSPTPVSSIISKISSTTAIATEQVQTSTNPAAETSAAESHKTKTKTEKTKTKTVMVTVTVTAPVSYATPSGSESCGP